MMIAIISDVHDNLANLAKTLNEAKARGASEVVCCGDVTNSETLEFLANSFTGPINLVRGNMEIYSEDEVAGLENINYFGRHGRLRLGPKEVGFCHEPKYFLDVLNSGPCDIVFYGHTHKPGETALKHKNKSIRAVNPGNVAGTFFNPTFAVWNTESDEIKLVLIDTLK